MKKNKFGQAEVLTEELYKKIKGAINKESHRLFFDIAYYTGERWGAIAQLKISDVYGEGSPLDEITFSAPTRKDTGHKSLSALSRYIEVTQEQRKQAIALL